MVGRRRIGKTYLALSAKQSMTREELLGKLGSKEGGRSVWKSWSNVVSFAVTAGGGRKSVRRVIS